MWIRVWFNPEIGCVTWHTWTLRAVSLSGIVHFLFTYFFFKFSFSPLQSCTGLFCVAVAPQGMMWESAITGPLQTTKKIHGLRQATNYMITVYALTQVGQGVENTIQATTVETSRTCLSYCPSPGVYRGPRFIVGRLHCVRVIVADPVFSVGRGCITNYRSMDWPGPGQIKKPRPLLWQNVDVLLSHQWVGSSVGGVYCVNQPSVIKTLGLQICFVALWLSIIDGTNTNTKLIVLKPT